MNQPVLSAVTLLAPSASRIETVDRSAAAALVGHVTSEARARPPVRTAAPATTERLLSVACYRPTRRIKYYYVELSRVMIGNRLFRANIRNNNNNNKNYCVFYYGWDHRRRAENCLFVFYILRIYYKFIFPAPITRALYMLYVYV